MNFKYRIVNFLVDIAAFLVFSIVILWVFKGIIEKESVRNFLIGFYFFYYFTSELVFGQTLGKMLTKTKVVDKRTGEKAKAYQILIRTFLRGLPFYFLSYFITEKGLHDHFSQTILIKF
ncbi:RDD family protein [Belliella pelovolcani]|uniref:RDD family protein n=1 Tax=Belliella pelovolcani TaxID=529505 RepID=UPI00391B2D89